MAKNIDPKLKKIGDYLQIDNREVFSIPEYQRAYSWGITQCDKLWQDIENFIDSGGRDPYFFGTIIISCEENDKKLSLIDGQQRTTTFILLFKALSLRINQAIQETENDKDSTNLHFALTLKRNRIYKILYKASDEEIFQILNDFNPLEIKDILINHSINELYKLELRTILLAEDFDKAESSVVKIPYKQKDNKYTNYFRNFNYFYNKFKDMSVSEVNTFAEYILDMTEIIEIRSWKVDQAITMFNSLNSDGMPLKDADIISAKLYSNAGDNREEFNQKWEELKKEIIDLENRRFADIDDILMQNMHIQRARTKEYLMESGSINVTTPGLRRYYTEINKELLEAPMDLSDNLLKIAQIWVEVKDYAIIKLISRFNENAKTYLISYLSRFELEDISKDLVAEFSKSLLKLFAVLELVDIGYSSNRFKTFLFGLNLKIVDPAIAVETLDELISDHIKKYWKPEDIYNNALEYNKNNLVFLNEYLFAKEIGQEFTLPAKYDIEHIMPASGKNIAQIRKDAGIEDKDEFKEVVNRLGNKILLEENINRSIGNAWFRTKVENSVKNKMGYKDSDFAIATSIVDIYSNIGAPTWDRDDIRLHTEKAAKRIVKFIFE